MILAHALQPGRAAEPGNGDEQLTAATPEERHSLEKRMADLTRRVRYIEERLRIVQRDAPRGD